MNLPWDPLNSAPRRGAPCQGHGPGPRDETPSGPVPLFGRGSGCQLGVRHEAKGKVMLLL